MPIAVYPGIALTGASVQDVVTSAAAQVAASQALHERYRTPVALSAMDLSVEAEAFGSQIHMDRDEIPTVTVPLVATLAQAKALRVPTPGEKRTRVYLDAVAGLKKLPSRPLVLAGTIGPFSLAGRLYGLSEACTLTLSDPDLMHVLLEKSTLFLVAYAQALKAAGADGLVMAEPAAGLLSPRSLATFSSAYIRQVVAAVEDGWFTVILHNCAAKLVHVPAMLEAGVKVVHYGAPMDVPGALGKVGSEITVCGNLDPTAVFLQSTPDQVRAATLNLLQATQSHRNFVISSGCDVPPKSPLANLDAFFTAVAEQPVISAPG
jgi:uroporphyrinogen decarboxylase